MTIKFALCISVASLVAGIGVGVVGLEAQNKPKAYMISDTEPTNMQDYPKFLTEVRAIIKKEGGTSLYTANGKMTVLEGEPPKGSHFGVVQWPTSEQAVDFYKNNKEFKDAIKTYGVKQNWRIVVEAEQ